MKNDSLAIYLPSLDGGGVERMRLILSAAFIARGMRVTIVLNDRKGELMNMVPPGVQVVSLGASRTLTALPRLVAYLRRERPAILMSSLGHNNIVALWAKRLAMVDTAVIICQHNALSNESSEMHRWQYRVLPLLYRLFCRWADAILAVSNGVADNMAQVSRLPRDRIGVIYNPVLFPGFEAKANETVFHRWLDDPSVRLFVGIGRLVHQKDFELLIHAFSLLDTALNARLIILGEGPLHEELQILANRLGVADRVELLGFKHNPLPYLRGATAMVVSSRYEGFGNVLVEGLACGTPVISTDCPYGPSEILADGKFGPLVPVGDPIGLRDAMAGILRHRLPAETLQTRARDFSVANIVDQYLTMFNKAVIKATRNAPRREERPSAALSPAASAAGAIAAEEPSRPASVAIYLPHLRPGGTEISILNLANAMHKQGVRVSIFIHEEEDGDLTGRSGDVRVVPLGVRHTLGALPALVRHLRAERPDVLLSALPHNNIVAVLARMLAGNGTRVVVTEHAPVTELIKQHSTLRYRVLPYLLPYLYRRADAVISVSEGVRDDLHELLSKPVLNSDVIYNPVLPLGWAEMSKEPIDAWFADEAHPVVLSVGRLSKEKSFPTLINAFAAVHRQHPHLRLAILGDGPEMETLAGLIKELGLESSARLPGFVANPYAYMSRAKVFVLPSLFEGFGNVLVEAMACGTDVISSDCPVGPREILNSGAFGTLVPPADVGALADALANVIERQEPIPAAKQRALQFTAEASSASYLRLFSGLRGKSMRATNEQFTNPAPRKVG